MLGLLGAGSWAATCEVLGVKQQSSWAGCAIVDTLVPGSQVARLRVWFAEGAAVAGGVRDFVLQACFVQAPA